MNQLPVQVHNPCKEVSSSHLVTKPTPQIEDWGVQVVAEWDKLAKLSNHPPSPEGSDLLT